MATLKQVHARSRKLQSRWQVEAASDASSTMGIDVEQELMDALTSAIADELRPKYTYAWAPTRMHDGTLVWLDSYWTDHRGRKTREHPSCRR